jgi:hypothetical protein
MSDLWAVMVANAPAAIDDEADGEAATAALEDYHENGGVSLAEIATPKPDSPVCVEVKGLEWEYPEYGFRASTPFGVYKVMGGDSISCPSLAWLDDVIIYEGTEDDEAMQACQADFTRRTLELVNARSVESVRAETVERVASYLQSLGHNSSAAAARSLTEGGG